MNDAPPPPEPVTPVRPIPAAPSHPVAAKKDESFLAFLVKLVLLVVVFRSFVFSPFNIPSESMLPRLLEGDYLLAAKWPYGYTSNSLPFSLPLIPGRVFAHQPHRGDVAIFKAPADMSQDWIKRVIGLPGDTVQMIGGQLYLNGVPIPKVREPDFINPVTPNMIATAKAEGRDPCVNPALHTRLSDGSDACRYPMFRETIPTGDGNATKSYDVLDMGQMPQDDTPPYLVPEGDLFMMGDNRDNSTDSRFPVTQGGVGMLPQENLVGRATLMMWSTDGSANWFLPWTWFTAARWKRIGGTF